MAVSNGSLTSCLSLAPALPPWRQNHIADCWERYRDDMLAHGAAYTTCLARIPPINSPGNCRVWVEWDPPNPGDVKAQGKLCIACPGEPVECHFFRSGTIDPLPGLPGPGQGETGGPTPPGTHYIHLPGDRSRDCGVGPMDQEERFLPVGGPTPGEKYVIVGSGTGAGRTWIGIHWDANCDTSPGSAGCIALPDEPTYIEVRDKLTEIVGLGSGIIPIQVGEYPPSPIGRGMQP